MKILYHHRIASKDGQYVHLSEIVRALTSQGHEVKVVGPDVLESSDMGHDGGWVTKLKSMLPKAAYEVLELGYSVLAGWRLYKEAKTFKPDVIYERYNLHQPAGVIVANALKIPIQLEVNAPLAHERQRHGGMGLPWLANKVEAYTWSKSDKVLPVSEVLAEHCLKAGVPRERIDVIHNGVRASSLDMALKMVKEAKRNKKEGDIIIGFVGFVHLTCGVEWAIEALKIINNKSVKLVCVGNGDNIEALKSLAEKAGVYDQVNFTGALERNDVFKMMATFDITLQPDVTDYASPLKMFEYMLFGTTIIAPDKENIKEILRPSDAVFFDHKKPLSDSFVSALVDAVNNFEKLECGKNALQRLQEVPFTWDNNAKRIVENFDELINQKG